MTKYDSQEKCIRRKELENKAFSRAKMSPETMSRETVPMSQISGN